MKTDPETLRDPSEAIRSTAIAENYRTVITQIEQIASQAGRNSMSVQLVVVTKGHPLWAVRAVIAAGARDLGENYVEEAITKINACADLPRVAWHMIGHVQRRKAQRVCGYFAWLHSLDSLPLARRLDRFASEVGVILPVLLECNVSGEETKFGWSACQEDQLPVLTKDIRELLLLHNLSVRGLMTMAPYVEDPEETRPFFRRLRTLANILQEEFPTQQYPGLSWKELSMGMSADYPVAVQEGATLVRIGTAIMGPRL